MSYIETVNRAPDSFTFSNNSNGMGKKINAKITKVWRSITAAILKSEIIDNESTGNDSNGKLKEIDIKELKEIIQSGHINLLIGAGCSMPFLDTLGEIEKKMDDEETKEQAQKEYYNLIRKSKAVLDESSGINAEKDGLAETKENYNFFLQFWADVISSRSLDIINKQVNIFTTNFDMFMEDACERFRIPYNDGFTGQIKPVFDVANFNKIQRYKSLQFDHISDIPLFNIIKLHGSVSWQIKDELVVYSNGSHIANDLDKKTSDEFNEGYENIAIINPNSKKHIKTVMDTKYASMLRKFVLELEKENSILIIIGFSMNDEHIKELLYGAMKSNPTLIVIYFSYERYNEKKDDLRENDNQNLYVISPEEKFSFEKTTKYLSEIIEKPQSIDKKQE